MEAGSPYQSLLYVFLYSPVIRSLDGIFCSITIQIIFWLLMKGILRLTTELVKYLFELQPNAHKPEGTVL